MASPGLNMNQETTATHLDQRSNLYDKVKSAPQASIYTDLHFATSGNAQRSPDEGQLSFAESKDATAKSTQAAPEGEYVLVDIALTETSTESSAVSKASLLCSMIRQQRVTLMNR